MAVPAAGTDAESLMLAGPAGPWPSQEISREQRRRFPDREPASTERHLHSEGVATPTSQRACHEPHQGSGAALWSIGKPFVPSTSTLPSPMPRTARQALAASLIVLHAAISLCGASLHAAPGLGHAGSAGSSTKADAHPGLTRIAATVPEHCPLCDYFSQGQLPLAADFVAASRLVLPFEPTQPPPLLPRSPHLLARPRAPPRGISRIV